MNNKLRTGLVAAVAIIVGVGIGVGIQDKQDAPPGTSGDAPQCQQVTP